MPRLEEGKIAHIFPEGWDVTKYDAWAFYRNQFQASCCGNKAIDFLAYDPIDQTLWLVELKDYRHSRRTKDERIWDEIALKARDTLAGLFAAKVALGHADHSYAVQALRAGKLRVVLHLEQPHFGSKLFPRPFDLADVQQRLKQMLKPIDAHPRVVELGKMNVVPWSAVSLP